MLSQTEKSKDKKVKSSDDDLQRFKDHIEVIRHMASEHNVQYIFGEIPAGAQDARAAFAFGGVTAILAGLSVEHKLITVTPAEVKVAATGMKHADKEDVILATHGCFPDAPWLKSKKPNAMNIIDRDGNYLMNANEHLADAIGVIQAGLKKVKK